MGNKFIKIINTLSVVMIVALSLSGCDEKKKTTTVATETDALVLEEISEDETVVENVVYESTGSVGSVDIDATVIMPEKINDCPIYSLEFDFFDDEDVKALVANIFDEGSYFLYMPYTTEQINLLRDKFTAMAPYAKNEDEEQAFSDALYNLDYREETLKSGAPAIDGEIKFYNMAEYTDYEDLSEYQCNVFGTIDGNYAVVYFSKDDYNCQMKLDLFGFINKNVDDTGEDSYDMRAMGNACSYSMSEAEDIAEEFVSSLGYENMCMVKTHNALLGSVEVGDTYINANGEEDVNYVQVKEPNGYNIYFGRGYGGYTVTYDANHFQSMYSAMYFDENGENPHKVTGDEFIRVYVSDYGVTQVEFCNPMKEVELMAEEVALLDFESVNQIAMEYFEGLADEYRDEWDVNEIELGYSIIEEEGKYAIIPTWNYMHNSDATNNYIYRSSYLIMNAIDGSKVWCITDQK